MFYFDGKEYSSFVEDEKDEVLIALEYDNEEITSITWVTCGYYDITFKDGMKLNAVSEMHIKRKN
tara:strand:+ start:283 stop:477 length:195 start_codon:yes stop_codon:yes gene_type:complete